MTKKLLFITQAVAPIGGSHSTRTTQLIKELSKLGWEISVLTTRVEKGTPMLDSKLEKKMPDNVKYLRTFPGPMHALAYKDSKINKTIPTANDSETKKVSDVKNTIKKYVGRIKKTLLIPDTYIEWLPFAIIDTLKNKKEVDLESSVIISSAVPYTSHLIGLYFKKKYNNFWIADYGDPWVYDPGNLRKGFRYIIERFLENQVVKNADIITVTTDNTKLSYLQNYKIKPDKVKVVPMAFDPEDFLNEKNSSNNSKFVFTYTGRLEEESRDTENFIQALEIMKENDELDNLVFKFVGSFKESLIKRFQKLYLNGNIEIINWIEHEECMKLLQNSQVLLLFGNNNEIQIPGKTFNYIGSQTPILYLSNIANQSMDPTLTVIKDSQVPYWVAENTMSDIRKMILKAVEETKVQNIGISKLNNNEIYKYTWEKRAKDLSKLLT